MVMCDANGCKDETVDASQFDQLFFMDTVRSI